MKNKIIFTPKSGYYIIRRFFFRAVLGLELAAVMLWHGPVSLFILRFFFLSVQMLLFTWLLLYFLVVIMAAVCRQ
jgi:hypothetical protein